VLDRPDGELRTRGKAELGKDVADVPLGGGLGDDELASCNSCSRPIKLLGRLMRRGSACLPGSVYAPPSASVGLVAVFVASVPAMPEARGPAPESRASVVVDGPTPRHLRRANRRSANCRGLIAMPRK
jgi:hypothetical protein